MIKSIIRCPNDMVIVFDEKGEQIPEYQGQYEEIRERILKDAPQTSRFGYFFDYEPELQEIPRDEW